MNTLERFRRTFAFAPTDRLPIHTFGAWDETIVRWRAEGLPADWQETNFFGEDRVAFTGVHLGTCGYSPFFPRMEEQVLEEDATYQILRDAHGRTLKKRRDEINESIAEYLAFPVTDEKSWEAFRRYLDPAEESRYAALEETAQQLGGIGGHDYPVGQIIAGPFRVLWHLMGDVNMYYAFYDHPDMVHDMMEHWLRLNTTALDRIVQRVDINLLYILEDMSCNTGMMISPALFREFLMPYYKRLVQHVRTYPSLFGICVDSDGDVRELIPLLLECGIDGMFPFEVQAGMDVTALREQYGSRLVLRGGIDKRELAKGRDAIDRELERVLPTFAKSGGYIIALDHQAPPDISLSDYLYFLEKARQYG